MYVYTFMYMYVYIILKKTLVSKDELFLIYFLMSILFIDSTGIT